MASQSKLSQFKFIKTILCLKINIKYNYKSLVLINIFKKKIKQLMQHINCVLYRRKSFFLFIYY